MGLVGTTTSLGTVYFSRGHTGNTPWRCGSSTETPFGLPSVPETSEAQQLAEYLIAVDAVPEKSFNDAMHLAIAAVHGMDYLLTWNQTHLFNADRIEMLYQAIRKAGQKPAVLVRPDGLLEIHHDS